MTPHQIVANLWNSCQVFRGGGLSYGDYVEQLTYLLFLRMAHECTQAPWHQPAFTPAGHDWPALLARGGDALGAQHRRTLEALGRGPGMLGLIFREAQNDQPQAPKLWGYDLRTTRTSRARRTRCGARIWTSSWRATVPRTGTTVGQLIAAEIVEDLRASLAAFEELDGALATPSSVGGR